MFLPIRVYNPKRFQCYRFVIKESLALHLLAISGSLRAASANTALLRAAIGLAPAGVTVELYTGLADLPHFNPDLDGAELPAPVLALRAHIGRATGLLICSPEYAHGVPGSLKNALDWLVSSVEFPGKPVALLNASRYSSHAFASLTETLTTMSAYLCTEASVTVPLTKQSFAADGTLLDAACAALLQQALATFVRAIEQYKSPFAGKE